MQALDKNEPLICVSRSFLLQHYLSTHLYISSCIDICYLYIYKLSCKCNKHSHTLPFFSVHTTLSSIMPTRYQWLDTPFGVFINCYLITSLRLSGKESTYHCRRHGFDPWVGKIPWGGNGNPFQYSCLENSMDRGVLWATVPGVAKILT